MRALGQPCLLACLLACAQLACGVGVLVSVLCREISLLRLTEYCEEPAVLLHWVVSSVLAAEESVREIGNRGSHRYLLQVDRAQIPPSRISRELLQGRGCDSNG